MDAAGLVVAEAGRIVDDRAEVELHRDITASLVDVGRVRVRAEQVKALRATKGKRLGRTTVELLEWIHDDLEDLARALDPDGVHDPGVER